MAVAIRKTKKKATRRKATKRKPSTRKATKRKPSTRKATKRKPSTRKATKRKATKRKATTRKATKRPARKAKTRRKATKAATTRKANKKKASSRRGSEYLCLRISDGCTIGSAVKILAKGNSEDGCLEQVRALKSISEGKIAVVRTTYVGTVGPVLETRRHENDTVIPGG